MITTLLTIASSVLLSAGVSEKTNAHHHAGYFKPGAAVSIMHDYDGQTKLGEFETVTATINHIYEDGALSVQVSAPPELQVLSSKIVSKELIFAGSTLSLPVQISGTSSGLFSLSFEITYEDPFGHQSRRVISIPVSIGKTSIGKTQSAKNEPTEVKSTGLIMLSAREFVE